MPITPYFAIGQTDTHVTLDIAVPHIRVRDVETVLTEDDTVLHFVTDPPIYLLLLSFAPHQLRPDPENDDSPCRHAQFDPLLRNGTVRLVLLKKDIGHWDDLDLIGRLQQQRSSSTLSKVKRRNGSWLVAVESSSNNKETGERGYKIDEDDDNEETTTGGFVHDQVDGSYGFARMFRGVYTDLARDGLAREMLELPWNEEVDDDNNDNDGSSIVIATSGSANCTHRRRRDDDATTILSRIHWERRLERIQMEKKKFCRDRYRADTFGCHDEYLYQCAMAMRPHWTLSSIDAAGAAGATAPLSSSSSSSTSSFFDQKELSLLLSVPYPLLPTTITTNHRHQNDRWISSLMDILFAYAYDHLLTDGEPTVESAWTISTLSATLATLDDWSDEYDITSTTRMVVESMIRRSLVYPYLRSYDFAIYVLHQVVLIFRRGRRTVIRCLLQIRRILDRSELYYLGNKLFIDPFLAWLQKCDHGNFDELMSRQADETEKMITKQSKTSLKDSIGLELTSIEKEFAAATHDNDDASSSSSSDDDGTTTSDSDESIAKEVSTAFMTELGNLTIGS